MFKPYRLEWKNTELTYHHVKHYKITQGTNILKEIKSKRRRWTSKFLDEQKYLIVDKQGMKFSLNEVYIIL